MTKPSNYLSLELSKALHEKGVRIESEFHWASVNKLTKPFLWFNNHKTKEDFMFLYAAPTVTEMAHWVISTCRLDLSVLKDCNLFDLYKPDDLGAYLISLIDKGIIQPTTA